MTYILGALGVRHTAKDNVGSLHHIHGSVFDLGTGLREGLTL